MALGTELTTVDVRACGAPALASGETKAVMATPARKASIIPPSTSTWSSKDGPRSTAGSGARYTMGEGAAQQREWST